MGDDSTQSSSNASMSFKDSVILLNFTPAWFAVNMGTGVVSSLFHAYPYGGDTKAMNVLGLAFFFLNLMLFIVFLVLSALRYILFPRIWNITVFHPVQSLYLGSFPMGAFTLINAALSIVHGYWGFGGVRFLYVLWAFWWLISILSFLCCFGVLYVMSTRHRHSISTLTPLWLLPVVTLIVASSSGQLLAAEIRRHSLPHAFLTVGMSIFMVVIGLSLALMIITLYFRRVLIDGHPDANSIISSFIPLGPCGQAGYSLLLAGQNLKETLPWGNGNVMSDPLAGSVLNLICFSIAFMLWCLGLWWLLSAIIAVVDTMMREKIPFKLGFWGLVFPNGVQALLTTQLAIALDARLFRVLGAIYGAAVILIWFVLAVQTLLQVFDGSIFHAAPGLEVDLMHLSNSHSSGDTEKARTQ